MTQRHIMKNEREIQSNCSVCGAHYERDNNKDYCYLEEIHLIIIRHILIICDINFLFQLILTNVRFSVSSNKTNKKKKSLLLCC